MKWIGRDSEYAGYQSLGTILKSITAGRRSDSASAYIHSTMRNYENLYLACNTKIEKIILDENNRAVGVQTVATKPLHPAEVKSYLPSLSFTAHRVITEQNTHLQGTQADCGLRWHVELSFDPPEVWNR